MQVQVVCWRFCWLCWNSVLVYCVSNGQSSIVSVVLVRLVISGLDQNIESCLLENSIDWWNVFLVLLLSIVVSISGVMGQLSFLNRQLSVLNSSIRIMLSMVLCIEQVLMVQIMMMIGVMMVNGICRIEVNSGMVVSIMIRLIMLFRYMLVIRFQMKLCCLMNSVGLGCSFQIIRLLSIIVVVVELGMLSVSIGSRVLVLVLWLVVFGVIMFFILFLLKFLWFFEKCCVRLQFMNEVVVGLFGVMFIQQLISVLCSQVSQQCGSLVQVCRIIIGVMCVCLL